MSERKQRAIVALAELFGRKLSVASVNMFVLASSGLADDQFEQAAAAIAQRSKFMPAPAELIELARCDGVTYEARAQLALEELEQALDENKPSLISKLTAAVARSIGGFQLLQAMPLAEFKTWKRKDFLATYTTLAKENPERLQAIAGPRSDIARSLSSPAKTLPTADDVAEQEASNRQKHACAPPVFSTRLSERSWGGTAYLLE